MKVFGIIIAVLNLGLLGFLGYSYLQKTKTPQDTSIEASASATSEVASPPEGDSAPPAAAVIPDEIYYPLETFIVNLNSPGGQRILKISLEFLLENQEVKAELNTHNAQYRDLLLTILSSKKFEEIDTREGKDILKAEITSTLNPFLKKGRITKVIITDIIYN